MSIFQKDGFRFDSGFDGDYIVVESSKLEKTIVYINKRHIEKAAIIYDDYRSDNINFLKNCTGINRIGITGEKIKDISGLYYLNKLKYLSITDNHSSIDLYNFPQLEFSIVGWHKKMYNLGECRNLSELHLWSYNPKNNSLEELYNLHNLKKLMLVHSNITSLSGCRGMMKLEKLEFFYLRKLQMIDEIEKNKKTLKHLWFDHCKKISNHAYVTKLKNLHTLAFNECGTIPSIKFIKKMSNLKNFRFVETNVLDGDLSPLLGIDRVGFFDKKHYSLKRKDFPEI